MVDKFGEAQPLKEGSAVCRYCYCEVKQWVGLTQTQVKLLREGVEKESIKTGDSIDWIFYTHINEALKEKNT
jgi:hypothetical protein